MGFLMRLFTNDTKLAEELASNEPLLRQSLDRYFAAYRTKQDALADLVTGKPMRDLLPAFRISLADELALIAGSEKTEKQIISELGAFHDREFQKINLAMNHIASQERYAYALLKRLHELLQHQAHTIAALQNAPENPALQDALVRELGLERQAVEQLQQVDNLTQFYKSLALGERRKQELEKDERAFAEEVGERMMDYEVMEGGELRPLSSDNLSWLTAHCFNKLEQEVVKAVDEGILDQHPHVVYEFVNSDLFEQFVFREIDSHDVKGLNDKGMIRQFIAIFRDLYNNKLEEEMEEE